MMDRKVLVILTVLVVSISFLPSGYSIWTDELRIDGTIGTGEWIHGYYVLISTGERSFFEDKQAAIDHALGAIGQNPSLTATINEKLGNWSKSYDISDLHTSGPKDGTKGSDGESVNSTDEVTISPLGSETSDGMSVTRQPASTPGTTDIEILEPKSVLQPSTGITAPISASNPPVSSGVTPSPSVATGASESKQSTPGTPLSSPVTGSSAGIPPKPSASNPY